MLTLCKMEEDSNKNSRNHFCSFLFLRGVGNIPWNKIVTLTETKLLRAEYKYIGVENTWSKEKNSDANEGKD